MFAPQPHPRQTFSPLRRLAGNSRHIETLDINKPENERELDQFLAYRCDRDFLTRYITQHTQFVPSLRVWSYLYAVSDVDVIIRLHEFGLLSEQKRLEVVATIRELAVDTPDSGFLQERVRNIITEEELADILEHVRTNLLINLSEQIDNWFCNYSYDNDPEGYFSELTSALKDYRNEFESDLDACERTEEALDEIEQNIEELRSEHPLEPDSEDYHGRNSSGGSQDDSRSVFDDVDL